ncbi:ARM repeat-containing protein [Histomonas meleagridis]|uniref:ARM repeat-containing protein n=1 Tax=Histomonas meleagridis TaxID=135588 RepID=UPI0035598294|nr:ARM repeat-containing protein [Histomonas meleagridis]KAH0805693.1 ARM repeat-containing protein [Histomonas meleagridis]
MSRREVLQLISDALDNDEDAQYMFAYNLHQVAAAFPQKVICEQFIPFLINWLPRNDYEVLCLVAKAIPSIEKAAGGIDPLSELIEALLASEDTEVVDTTIESFGNVNNTDNVILNISKSKYDKVRVYCLKFPQLSANEELAMKICKNLIKDPSFLVRFAVAEYIPKLSHDNAFEIAKELMNDEHPRIRAYLPVVCCKMDFFFDMVPTLLTDPDWGVRSSLATGLIQANDPVKSCEITTKLISDSIWQVKLCALRSLTALLPQLSPTPFPQGLSVISILSKLISSPHYHLKIAVIDCFFAIGKACQGQIPSETLQAFADELLAKQKNNIKLHFIKAIVLSKSELMASMISSNISSIIDALSRDDQWRVRFGIVEELERLAELLPKDSNYRENFKNVYIKLLEDEAYPVRMAAIHNLALSFVNGEQKIPNEVIEMKSVESFRKRQTALLIMQEMYKNTKDDELKKVLKDNMSSLFDDKCKSVALLAKKLVEEIS